MTTTPDLILLGPAPPYRGGIADTQWQFAQELQRQKKSVLLWTFTHLYPAVLFPGKTQFSTNGQSSVLLNVKFTLITLGNGNKLPKRLTPFLQKLLFFAIGHLSFLPVGRVLQNT